MGLLDLNGIKREVQNQHSEFFLKKEEVQHQNNETTCGDKTDNTNCTTNIYNNYGSTLSTDTQGYIAQCIKELFGKSEEEFGRRVRAYIDKRIDEKFEEIKANFIPKTAEPRLEIVSDIQKVDIPGYWNDVYEEVLYIKNSGNVGVEHVSITVPEDEKERILLPSSKKEGLSWDNFEIKDCFIPANSLYSLYAGDILDTRPRKFHLDYWYCLQGGEQEHRGINVLLTRC